MPARPTLGRPYFVMELVQGVPITEFCDENKLSTEERLELFIQVCQAIQHAHQKGIIHRDIKPSNMLVTLHDGVPVPKVIDFGIAKAIEPEAHREDAVHRLRDNYRHAGLHEPGASGDERPGYRHAQRHLQSGRAALRIAHRHDTVSSERRLRSVWLSRDATHHSGEEPERPSTRLSQVLGR